MKTHRLLSLLAAIPALAGLAVLAGCGPQLPLSLPQWSPPGDRVAFVRYADGDVQGLFLLSPGAQEDPVLVSRDAQRFAFAPGGERLYYLGAIENAGAGLVSVELGPDGPGKRAVALAAGKDSAFTELAAAPSGLVYLQREDKGKPPAIVEFDPKGDKQRTLSPAGTGWSSPILAGGGRELYCLARGKDEATELLRKPLPEGDPQSLIRFEGGEVTLLACSPRGDKVLLGLLEKGGDGAAGGEKSSLVLVDADGAAKGRRDFPLPPDLLPMAASFSPDGNRIYFPALRSAEQQDSDDLAVESHELDVRTGATVKLAGAVNRLVGARAYASDGRRYMEFTPSGPALLESGKAEPLGLWPMSFGERAAAARAALAAGRPDRAAELAASALEKSSPIDDRAELSRIKAEALETSGKPAEAANAYLESLLRYPVSDRREPAAQAARRLARYAEAAPENRLLFSLAEAWKARAAGKPDAAAAEFKEAAALSADRAWSAGINFAAAETLLEGGGALAAGGLFRKASEAGEFPQADWAGALAAVAYALAGRDDLAGEELQRCQDLFPQSALAPDVTAMAKAIAVPAGKPRTAEEAKAADGAAGARLEAWPATGRHVSFTLRRPPSGPAARIAVLRYEQWRLVLSPAEGDEKVLLDKVPATLSKLSFSPDGRRLAFLAGEGRERSLYAVDLAGAALLGDLKKLAAGETDPKTRAEDYRWPEGGGVPVAAKENE